MIYELMHKEIIVAEIEIDDKGNLKRILHILAGDHFPYGTCPKKNTNDPSALSRWWDNRRIPISRDDLEKAQGISLPKFSTPGMILLACKGLSLSDCYWIREKGSNESFENLNFFDNDFSYDLGDLLVGKTVSRKPSMMSPDGTSEGNLKKRWKIVNGHRILLKSGTPPFRYEIYNEIIASTVMKHLNVPHVDYFIMQDDMETYCGCDDFVGSSQDFVTAYMIHESNKKSNSESEYEFMIRCYEMLGIDNAREVINTMLLVDYILGNEDRHLNNFGLLRDAKTLRFLGPAPIFDTGSSLGFDRSDEALLRTTSIPWKPFASRSKPTQLDYIDHLPGINKDALFSLAKIVSATMESMNGFISKQRQEAILRFISRRVAEIIKRYAISREIGNNQLSKTQLAIISYFHSNGGTLFSAQDASNALGISKITVLRNLDVLVKAGYIERVGSRKTGYWTLTR